MNKQPLPTQELADKIKEAETALRHGEKSDYWRKQIRSATADLKGVRKR